MLKHLRIQNIILIEQAEINFEKGLNVLSGETGAGKSAIMNALNLICGDRSDSGLIRRGFSKGIVEGLFDVSELSTLLLLLEESGIDHSADEELIIRREISSEGKGRCFINNQPVQQSLLKKVTNSLVDISGQHANQRLLSVDKHREMTDLFGGLEEDVSEFSKNWAKEVALESKLSDLIISEAQRLREIEVCLMEIEELREANIKEGEDEELFAEYSLLANADELATRVSEIIESFTAERQPVLALLNRQKVHFDQLVRMDPSLADTAKSFENALIELQEVAYTIQKYQGGIEHNPNRMEFINERLSLINRLKRKYGSTVSEIKAYQKVAETKLRTLESIDAQIIELKDQLTECSAHNRALSNSLSKKRAQVSKQLEIAVIEQLRALNMPKVDFHCVLSPQKRNKWGEDKVEFFLSPNVGERQVPIKDCASGGELSRVMLALQTLLAGKECIPTLIFDEIDANIGGETASIVGEKLREIANEHQVLCITHFAQVAKQAHHHLQVSKQEQAERTFSTVKSLGKKERQQELQRMQGGCV